MKLYEDDGWQVNDLRYGYPFDAKATKGDDVLYLEAKGTMTSGERVVFTCGEVAWARRPRGKCVIGILSGITLKKDGSVDLVSGELCQFVWDLRMRTSTRASTTSTHRKA